ncbi:5-oxoprolinase/urea amidolyase family protein [Acidisoma sp. 7E03]
MFRRILVANRGEILGRVMRSARGLGIETVAVYSDADRFAPPVLAADHAVHIGPASAAESYLNLDAILAACAESGAEAVHPGYGFLSEKPAFAEALAAAGITFIGPRAEHLRAFGLKHTARALARAAGVPLLPGTEVLASADEAAAEAAVIGYPVMLKSSAGGGGIGMALCADEAELRDRYATIARLAANNFGDAALFLEKFVARARHVEVQVFGDGKGGVVSLGTRDCSLQRRNQKVVEETPAPGIGPAILAAMEEAARALCASIAYASAGTVEFVYDAATEAFYFLEVNTRLQVEHGVTEAVYGIDLVDWMIRLAAGDFRLPAQESLVAHGAAIEARLYAEDPAADFRPASGLLTDFAVPEDIRVDRWVERGTEVSPFYDPMLAKLIATGATRDEAIARLRTALAHSRVAGIATNLDYLHAILDLPDFRAGTMTTRTLGAFDYRPRAVAVLEGGAQTTLQSLPGRLGFWEVGIPPSGPMDARSFARANGLVGNAAEVTALELTLTGPTLRFDAPARIALTGAAMEALLDGVPLPHDTAVEVAAGQVLMLGAIEGPGQRSYLAVRGGFAVPEFLGSTATFTLGGFGGLTGAALQAGDSLPLGDAPEGVGEIPERAPLTRDWTLAVRYGPHGSPDFFTDADIQTLFFAAYEVHHNSARTGVRLVGPKPAWARADGGEAGLHPSNIHDNAYAVGAIDFTGDMPILLGPDGPSLGGFVCPAVVTAEDRWKLGQLAPGDTVRFQRADAAPAILTTHRDVVVRRAGDEHVLVEFGPMQLDLGLRLRAQMLRDGLAARQLPGIIDLTPGIRSLQVHFDPHVIARSTVLDAIAVIDTADAHAKPMPSRTVYLPLSWRDPDIMLAMRKYQETVRPNAPWCPDNIEFIRRINGLASEEEVKRIVFEAEYLVMGLGDVYLGAPVATPVDPRHRLVTTKYNPARTWTPQNAVGIGGAYLCVYGMEGPGGYQLFGRTIQMWNSWKTTEAFPPGSPWLLRHFDRIRFYPVDHAELQEMRAAFPHGRFKPRIEEGQFSLAAYERFCAEQAEGITAFKARQHAAFEAERAYWAAEGLDTFDAPDAPPAAAEAALAPGERGVTAPVPGSVWQVLIEPGAAVAAGDTIAILESMKMEVRVRAAFGGTVRQITAAPGQVVRAGQRLAVIGA